MSAGQPSGDNGTYLLDLTLPQLFHRRSGEVVGTIGSREICEVVSNPGRNFVHESLRIDKGGVQ